jgi:hypothetical protein
LTIARIANKTINFFISRPPLSKTLNFNSHKHHKQQNFENFAAIKLRTGSCRKSSRGSGFTRTHTCRSVT